MTLRFSVEVKSANGLSIAEKESEGVEKKEREGGGKKE
jgi:hypothetical protein